MAPKESKKLSILAVDDEEANLSILEEWLETSGYIVLTANSGEDALEILNTNPDQIDIILLDRMMPGLDGIEVLHRIKEREATRHIPVIMQTAAAASQQVVEGIQAGVHYYLTKPYDRKTLLAIVDSAGHTVEELQNYNEELFKNLAMLDCMESSTYLLNTLDQTRRLSIYLGKMCPPSRHDGYGFTELSFAFSEIITNAIEHGNLGITYDEKTALLLEGGKETWLQEIDRRQKLPQYKDKKVRVTYARVPNEIIVRVIDEGQGFDWKRYMDIDPLRAVDNHGRGIALAALIFDQLNYEHNGREAICHIRI